MVRVLPLRRLELGGLFGPLRTLLRSRMVESAVSPAATSQTLPSGYACLISPVRVRVLGHVPQHVGNSGKEFIMLYYATMFLFVGFIAGALNMAGVATVATQTSWTLLLSGIVMLMIHLLMGRTGQVS